MIYRQNLNWIVEKEIQSRSVFLACFTKFLLTLLPISHFFSHQKSKFPISFPIWMSFASLIESSTLNQERKKKNIAFRLEIWWSLLPFWGYFNQYLWRNIVYSGQLYCHFYNPGILPLLSNLIRFPSSFPSKAHATDFLSCL